MAGFLTQIALAASVASVLREQENKKPSPAFYERGIFS
ncbi:hypothetical protein ATPR_3241 [Acetobacter tropicalis NBRC 101654]|uniref:Uncharacterized protein n=1 Tax=Acetobacter tropicalis NBRC 101654 TaxID=749388 RepID=F7VIP2_9PROT|nr:hypothetical protein ATPR_3241 [Acetobacter tropicalis NBRC 101654]